MEDFFGDIAEQKIRESIAKGESQNLPGAGKPLNIENLYFLPPEFIFAYTVLKNSGYLNLTDEEKAPVSLTKDEIETTSVPLVDDEIISLNKEPSLPNNIEEKTLNYSIIRECRRGRF